MTRDEVREAVRNARARIGLRAIHLMTADGFHFMAYDNSTYHILADGAIGDCGKTIALDEAAAIRAALAAMPREEWRVESTDEEGKHFDAFVWERGNEYYSMVVGRNDSGILEVLLGGGNSQWTVDRDEELCDHAACLVRHGLHRLYGRTPDAREGGAT